MSEAARGYRRLGLEAHGVTWAQQRAFAGEWFPDAEMVPTEHLVEELRRVKEPAEVARIHAACAIADEALAVVAPRLADRPSERDVALWLELEMRDRGAAGTSFDPIVASGPNGAKPHARPTDRRIEPGEPVVIDFGCIMDGYCSDMTRTLSVGDPGPDARRVYEVVREAQQTGRDAVAAGADCARVDKACRDVIDAAGWGDAFVHGTGHGVGLEIHEAPRVAATARDTLARGYVVTVEPGVYLPGVGGVRIEDTVVVTDDGADVLTGFSKDFLL
jgi:Xaa-Pro aminopeptidase